MSRFRVSLEPAPPHPKWPGEWYLVKVYDGDELCRVSNMLPHDKAVKEQLECIALYCDGRVPV